MQGIENLLSAIGFVKSANNYEWKVIPKTLQEEEKDQMLEHHNAVITYALKSLEAFKEVDRQMDKSSSGPDSGEKDVRADQPEITAPASPLDSKAQNANEIGVGTDQRSPVEQVPLTPSGASGKIQDNVVTPSSPRMAEVPSADGDGDGEQAPYPATFGEVLRMAQQGITPPGVKTVPNKISQDSDSLLKTAMGAASMKPSAPKPWSKEL